MPCVDPSCYFLRFAHIKTIFAGLAAWSIDSDIVF
jgi:hypothetical protein